MYALTCENAEEDKVFRTENPRTMTSYHDGSLRWSGNVARRHDLELAKAQVSAVGGVPPPSDFGLGPVLLAFSSICSVLVQFPAARISWVDHSSPRVLCAQGKQSRSATPL